AISDKLENLEAGGESKISPVLHHLAEVIRRRSLVIVLSDFFDNVDDLLGAFAHFRFKHHEIIALHLMDDAEMDFPIEQPTLFECMEQSRQILADPRIVRQSYLSKLDEFMSGLRQGCRRQDVDYQLMRLSEPFDQALATYLARRSVKTG
ncbi:MAG: DUF58 domain-containing protein, partial [Planctomycetia bacterium]|nr:DUF58 domain-containing protein [Planctomycetia bacterium]